MVTADTMKLIFSDLWSIHFNCTAVLITVFTIIYSFIFSKKEELKLLKEREMYDQEMTEREKARKGFVYIKLRDYTKLNTLILSGIILSFILFVWSWFSARACVMQTRTNFITLCTLSGIVLLLYVFILIKMISGYFKHIRSV